jgi:hypothetical protein
MHVDLSLITTKACVSILLFICLARKAIRKSVIFCFVLFHFNTLSICITKKLSGEVGSQVSLYRAVNDDSWEVDVASFWMKYNPKKN